MINYGEVNERNLRLIIFSSTSAISVRNNKLELPSIVNLLMRISGRFRFQIAFGKACTLPSLEAVVVFNGRRDAKLRESQKKQEVICGQCMTL
jgi:hypothetical protein